MRQHISTPPLARRSTECDWHDHRHSLLLEWANSEATHQHATTCTQEYRIWLAWSQAFLVVRVSKQWSNTSARHHLHAGIQNVIGMIAINRLSELALVGLRVWVYIWLSSSGSRGLKSKPYVNEQAVNHHDISGRFNNQQTVNKTLRIEIPSFHFLDFN